MRRNKFVNHKGRHRKFTNPEELELERRKDEEKKKLRRERGGGDADDSANDGDTTPMASSSDDSESEGSSSSSNEIPAVMQRVWFRRRRPRVPNPLLTEKVSKSMDESDIGVNLQEAEGKAKGVGRLIAIENPNRVQRKTKKLTNATPTEELPEKPQLSRREREEIEKHRARAHYQKMHAEGKTEEARADLARLAIIKQQREEAQRRREEEKRLKEDASKAKTAMTQKALGKRAN